MQSYFSEYFQTFSNNINNNSMVVFKVHVCDKNNFIKLCFSQCNLSPSLRKIYVGIR